MTKHTIITNRFFIICTAGRECNNSLSFNTFSLIVEDGIHPTYKKCLEVSETKYPHQRKVTLLSISEIQESDFIVFTSDK